MMRIFNIHIIYSLFAVMLLCPLSSAISQEPGSAGEENTLGDGLKAVKEAEGKITPKEDINTNQEGSLNNENIGESEISDPAANVQGPNTVNTPKAPQADNSEQKALPRGDALITRQKPRYDSTGMRDPFRPFLKLIDIPKGPDPIVRPPLRRYPLGSFRLAGIIWIGDEPKAMIVDPEANTYFLGVGDGIGNKEGVILEVRDRGILVQEQTKFENVYGEVKTETKKSVLAFQN